MDRKWRLISISLVLVGVIAFVTHIPALTRTRAAQSQSTLSFSPDPVSPSVNGGQFSISLSGPPNSVTTLFVDSWLDGSADSGTFVNFGNWLSTGPSGSINKSRTLSMQGGSDLNCSAYNSYMKDQNYDLRGKKLHQRIYVQFADGTRSPEATQTKDCTTTASPTASGGHPDIPSAPSSANGLISFVKTIFYNSEAIDVNSEGIAVGGGYQHIEDMTAWGKNGDKFVLSGHYGGSFAGILLNANARYGGGGLWTVAEDGSKIVEINAAKDGGSASDAIGQHGIRTGANGAINLEWSNGGGFVMGNGSMGSCSDNCTIPARGAYQAVYYKQDANGYPYIVGKLGYPEGAAAIANVFKNKVIANNDGRNSKLYSLPQWTDLGAADTSVGGLSFGNNIINFSSLKNSIAEVYSVAEDGTIEDTGQNLVDPGYTWNYNYSWDWSAGFPPKFGIWEVKTQQDGWVIKNTAAKVKVFKLAADGNVVLDKTMNAPLNPGFENGGIDIKFGIWGDYLVTGGDYVPTSIPVVGMEGRFYRTAPIYIWKGNEKVDTVMLPIGDIDHGISSPIAISKNGYVLIDASWEAPRAVLVYLYKLNLANSTVIPPSTGGGGGTTGGGGGTGGGGFTIGSGGDCYSKYKGNTQLVDLCQQIESLKQQVCQMSPTVSFCTSPQTQ